MSQCLSLSTKGGKEIIKYKKLFGAIDARGALLTVDGAPIRQLTGKQKQKVNNNKYISGFGRNRKNRN